MMSPIRIFRLSIVASILLGVLGGTIDALFPALVPEVLWQAHEIVVPAELRTQDIVILVLATPLIVAAIVGAIGLYQFRAWAPRFALYVTLACFLTYPLLDVAVVSPWSLLLTEASMILWGVVLAMAFLPPLSARFERLRANNALQRTGGEPPAAERGR